MDGVSAPVNQSLILRFLPPLKSAPVVKITKQSRAYFKDFFLFLQEFIFYGQPSLGSNMLTTECVCTVRVRPVLKIYIYTTIHKL